MLTIFIAPRGVAQRLAESLGVGGVSNLSDIEKLHNLRNTDNTKSFLAVVEVCDAAVDPLYFRYITDSFDIARMADQVYGVTELKERDA